jgi:hypothetical protein
MQPNTPQSNAEIVLVYKTQTLATDAPIIIGKSDGSIDLAFLQMNTPGQPVADVVAAIRLKDLDALKALHEAIGEHIRKEEKAEK